MTTAIKVGMTDSIDRVSQEVRDKNSSILEKHKK